MSTTDTALLPPPSRRRGSALPRKLANLAVSVVLTFIGLTVVTFMIGRVIGLVGYSVPVFWLGLVGLLVFYAKFDWVSGPGRLDVFYDGVVPTVTGIILIDSLLAGDGEVFLNALSHLVLPAALLGYL